MGNKVVTAWNELMSENAKLQQRQRELLQHAQKRGMQHSRTSSGQGTPQLTQTGSGMGRIGGQAFSTPNSSAAGSPINSYLQGTRPRGLPMVHESNLRI